MQSKEIDNFVINVNFRDFLRVLCRVFFYGFDWESNSIYGFIEVLARNKKITVILKNSYRNFSYRIDFWRFYEKMWNSTEFNDW